MKETAEFVDILPIGQQHFIALLGQQRQKDGQYNKLSILEAGQSAVTLQSVGLSPALLADTQGAIWLQSFVDGTGVQQQQISGAPR